MSKTAVFFGPQGGSVHKVAQMAASELGSDIKMVSIQGTQASELLNYERIIMGISTVGRANWDSSHQDSGWDAFLTQMQNMNLAGKRVAIFGLGDALTYPENFVDAMAILYDRCKELGATIDGECLPDGYQFTDSTALRNGKFIGLPIDEDNEPELTTPRLQAWIKGLKALGY
ncbi:flavodoxin I [Breznakibacter xylanolyticus]|uniref:Flavodoxin n=1 Tax=Breznakibacter xylanolyticus TaxID=990 RepID=A0A2W7NDF6_9BACT|nr:flavodoxin [Breznakibacter xylanolyticus]MBN2743781.1 flavodoxin [Marinilabiliaceae bacterium]PZX18178.1 flavodoxin I [Breznakibacter xylanolyticus]